MTRLSQAQLIQVNKYVLRAGELTERLIELYTQLAFDKGSELRVRSEAFQSAIRTNNVTIAREEATLAGQHYAIQCLTTQGEIDGLLLALAHCDRVIKYWMAL